MITPHSIINGAIKLIIKQGWRRQFYAVKTTINNKESTIYHSHNIPCAHCGIDGYMRDLTVMDALLRSFNMMADPCWKNFGELVLFGDITADKNKLRQTLGTHELPYYDAKCLLARADKSIVVKEVSAKDGFLFPFIIDLYEWNERPDQSQGNVLHVLQLAANL